MRALSGVEGTVPCTVRLHMQLAQVRKFPNTYAKLIETIKTKKGKCAKCFVKCASGCVRVWVCVRVHGMCIGVAARADVRARVGYSYVRACACTKYVRACVHAHMRARMYACFWHECV